MNKINTIFKEFKFFIWRKLIERRFFNDVTFENKVLGKVLKTSIMAWIFDLKEYKNIEVENFVSLLSEYSDVPITFPIKIGGFKHHLYITDNSNTKLYFYLNYMQNNDLNFYSIETINEKYNREFEYELTPFGTIVPYQYRVMLLNNGIHTDKYFKATFNNRNNNPNIVFKNGIFSLTITLSIPNYFYSEIERYLFTLVDKTIYFYNILPVFVHIKNNLGYHLPISITCYKDLQVLAKINTYLKFADVEYVHEYSFTEFVSEKESSFHTIEIEDSLKNFLNCYFQKETI